MKKLILLLFIGLFINIALIANSAALINDPSNEAAELGWTAANNSCGGYFADAPLIGEDQPPADIKTAPITIQANQSQLVYNGRSVLSGKVELSQPGRQVNAEQGSLITKNGDYLSAELKGKVIVQEKNRLTVSREAQFDLQQKWYQLKNAVYRLLVTNHLSGWGSAETVTQLPSGMTVLNNISYSTCPPQSRAWHIDAKKLTLNHDTGRGAVYDAALYAGNIPILYTPILHFPIDNRRQSGFLYPLISYNSQSGIGFGTPFYWNIAANYDDTITPNFYQKRGFQLNNLYRYLTSASSGKINFSILPNDAQFRRFQQTQPGLIPPVTPQIIAGMNELVHANPARSFFAWQNSSQFDSRWSGKIDYTRVNDDYYLQDFGGVPLLAQNQLLQAGKLYYSGEQTDFLANFQAFQTLHPVNEPIVQNQYNMLPQLLFTSKFAPKANRFNIDWAAEGIKFTQAKNPGVLNPSPSGERLNLLGTLSFPWTTIAGYFTPALSYELTQYFLSDQLPGNSSEITRALPFFDIDTGLYFVRNTTFLLHHYTQTLEPRIFYVYIPFRNQTDIPVFDSSLQPFNFNQLFLVNRYSGTDRIGDTQQISGALTSRFLDPQTGDEKLSASIGIIKYLQTRKVTLCQTVNCQDSSYSMGSSSPDSAFSPIAAQLNYHLSQNWHTTINTAWDPGVKQTQNANLNFQYSPAENHIFNIGYAYIRHGDFFTLPNNTVPVKTSDYNLSQPTTSFAWPLNDRWNIIGSLGYSLNRHHALTYFGGVEYNSCCWGTQLIAARTFSGFNADSSPQYNTGIFIQLAFKGLAKVAANDPGSLLLTNIPGYNDTFAA